ncbi:hypothetical protein CL656_07000 [bacterium]|mgnify:CR=1 FL=1|nr:hypothetical protein [bacterium]|tara:strand:- start:8644 stop:9171 length:528 start_codon:yes stop_codon:yes gene_type:complete
MSLLVYNFKNTIDILNLTGIIKQSITILKMENIPKSPSAKVNLESINPNLNYAYLTPQLHIPTIKDLISEEVGYMIMTDNRGLFVFVCSEPITSYSRKIRSIDLSEISGLELESIETNLRNLSDDYLEANSLTEKSSAVVLEDYGSLLKVSLLAEEIRGQLIGSVVMLGKDSIQK